MQVLEALSWGRNPFWPMSQMHPNALFMQSTVKPLLQPVAENRCEQQGMSQNWTKMISNKCSIVIWIFLLESYFHHRFPIRITISYRTTQPLRQGCRRRSHHWCQCPLGEGLVKAPESWKGLKDLGARFWTLDTTYKDILIYYTTMIY